MIYKVFGGTAQSGHHIVKDATDEVIEKYIASLNSGQDNSYDGWQSKEVPVLQVKDTFSGNKTAVFL